MGSMARMRSTHYADAKGKGILYEDDDEPIKLVDRDDANVIKEFGLSLIGKILNPKKQNVEKLLQTMPGQWGLEERITANDLGNGKFLFNFENEEDLKYVLSKGPFHYNFCMFVLVRWEPIVHDDYPWVIPFWVQLIGFPLHLWTDKNLENIGGRIGFVETMELTEGRMLIHVDSRRPLKFSRKADYKGDEVTIEIKYDMLFKHCTLCGMLTHEKGYCPTLDIRPGVFSRVQLSQDQEGHETSRRDNQLANKQPRQYSLTIREAPSGLSNSQGSGYDLRSNLRGSSFDKTTSQERSWEDSRRRGNHTDRIIRRRDDHPRYDEARGGKGPYARNRYGEARSRSGPYDRTTPYTWRPKPVSAFDNEKRDVVTRLVSHEIASSEFSADRGQLDRNHQAKGRDGDASTSKKLASTIVTPSRRDDSREDNVTVRHKGEAKALTFSPLSGQEQNIDDEQIIGALSGMDIVEQQDGGVMEVDAHGDDLLGVELMELEEKHADDTHRRNKEERSASKTAKHKKLGVKKGASLGTPSRKLERLRRGSEASRQHREEPEASRRHRHGLKKSAEYSSKQDV